MKVVLSGSASCGKTTLINALHNLGYNVVPEAAREVFEREKLTSHSPISTFTNQFRIYQRQLELEESLDPRELYFLDRGLVDNVAYSRFLLGETPLYVKDEDLYERYDRVYMLERLPLERDSIRREQTESDLMQTENYLRNTYASVGYSVNNLPKFSNNPEKSLELRVRHILDAL